ncbi:Hypothetical predicted protein [Paramuricea clavata]|uniref:Uncharacterized protein n=1 Tax=Paramuricea clavata TaxID=317549 RepID=A0A6S7GQU5_PARCT|nr:Hypothetical predicted protein [Paramuricea clavata]
MKPTGVPVQDEMFPEGVDAGLMDMDEACSSNMMVELAASERAVHGDFFNAFGDLFDDDDLS